jgi:hypothetical protein
VFDVLMLADLFHPSSKHPSSNIFTDGLNNNFTGFFPIINVELIHFNELFSKKKK